MKKAHLLLALGPLLLSCEHENTISPPEGGGGAPIRTAILSVDGKSDLVWRDAETDDYEVWVMEGTKYSEVSFALPSAGDGSTEVQVADLTGDGRPELVWRNYTTGWVRIWSPAGGEYPGVTTRVRREPNADRRIVWAADFSGDGQRDLVWFDDVSGSVYAWAMHGVEFGGVVGLGNAPTMEWALEGTADFTGDGKPDLLFRNRVTGSVLVRGMTGADPSGFSERVGRQPNLEVSLRAVADIDGDGDSDLVWQNGATGPVLAWRLDGTVVAEQLLLARRNGKRFTVVGAADVASLNDIPELEDEEDFTISGRSRSVRWYRIDATGDETNLHVLIENGSGNPDVSIHRQPWDNERCASRTEATSEVCQVHEPSAGRYYIRIDGTRAYRDVDVRVDLVTDDDEFDIEVRYLDANLLTNTQKLQISLAADYLESIITRDLEGAYIRDTYEWGAASREVDQYVDDLLILVDVRPIDGTGNLPAKAGYATPRWEGQSFPLVSMIRFEAADIGSLGNDALQALAAHQILHALGLGTIWDAESYSFVKGSSPAVYFDGNDAKQQFTLKCPSFTGNKVPLENDGVHFRESVMAAELMTPVFRPNGGWSGNPLGTVTIGALDDLAYRVGLIPAKPWSCATPNPAGPSINLQGDTNDGPTRKSGRPGVAP